ncbi:hypothetical protein NB2BOR_A19920 [Bordetella parapertussis]|nr:hypothetical protein NB2BOR_A19920 [Bordetella parapertussis]
MAAAQRGRAQAAGERGVDRQAQTGLAGEGRKRLIQRPGGDVEIVHAVCAGGSSAACGERDIRAARGGLRADGHACEQAQRGERRPAGRNDKGCEAEMVGGHD